jgi:hypothetical protein
MIMRRIAVLLYIALGSLTAACGNQTPLGPTQLDQVEDNSLAAGKSTTDGTSSGKGGKVGGSAGGVKGTGR